MVCEAIVASGRTEEEIAAATEGVKALLSFYGSTPSYKPVLDVEGWGDLQPELNRLSKQGEWAEMSKLIDDDVLRTIGVFGTPEDCGREIVQRFGAIRRPSVLLLPGIRHPAGRPRRARRHGALRVSEYHDLRFEIRERVATITLHRPDVRNAFGGSMKAELEDAYRRCDADDDIRAVVLTGTPPAFCAGADLCGGGDTFAHARGVDVPRRGDRSPAWEIRKPVIAAVNGHAIGLGLTLAIQCDLRFMAADAKYGVVQVRRGVMGDAYCALVIAPHRGHGERGRDPAHRAHVRRGRDATSRRGESLPPQRRGAAGGAGARARHRGERRADVGRRTASDCCGRASSSTAPRSDGWRPSSTTT